MSNLTANPMTNTALSASSMMTSGWDSAHSTESVLIDNVGQNPLAVNNIETMNKMYRWDMSEVVVTRSASRFPLSFALDMNSKPANQGDAHTFMEQDDPKDQRYHDLFIDKLRIVSQGSGGSPLDINSTTKRGGAMIFRTLTSGSVAKLATALNGTAVSDLATGFVNTTKESDVLLQSMTYGGSTKQHMLPLAWGLGTGEEQMCGEGTTCMNFIIKLQAVLKGYNYTGLGKTNAITEVGGTKWYGWVHGAQTGTVHAMFNDLAYKVENTPFQEHSVLIGIDGFMYSADYRKFVLFLNFNLNNLDEPLVAGKTRILLEEIIRDSTNFKRGFTRLSTRVLLGMYNTVPDAIEQGSEGSGRVATGFQYDVEGKTNYSQIIQSERLDISGTLLATQNKLRLNQPELTRERILMDFKTKRRNIQLFGKGASKKRNAAGKIVQSSAGIFDTSMFPLNYKKMYLNRYGAGDKLESLKKLAERFAKSAFAFNYVGPDHVLNVYISTKMANLLDELFRDARQREFNIMGINYKNNPKEGGEKGVDFTTNFTDVRTDYGTLRFTVDPGLDYLTSIILPSDMGDANPKHLLMALDSSKISSIVTRAPFLRGGIQGNDADYVSEDMMSEETIELLDPSKHTIATVTVV